MAPGVSGGFDHVHAYVPSRREAAAWYDAHLGFKVAGRLEFWAADAGGPLTIADAGDTVHLALFRSQEKKPFSVAFQVSPDEYASWKRHFDQRSMRYRETDHEISRSLYISDPWENLLEFTTWYEDG